MVVQPKSRNVKKFNSDKKAPEVKTQEYTLSKGGLISPGRQVVMSKNKALVKFSNISFNSEAKTSSSSRNGPTAQHFRSSTMKKDASSYMNYQRNIRSFQIAKHTVLESVPPKIEDEFKIQGSHSNTFCKEKQKQ